MESAQVVRAATAGQHRWQRPQQGRFKCNIDAAFSVRNNLNGICICFRDEHGAFVLAKTLSFSTVFPVANGEAMGLWKANVVAHALVHEATFSASPFIHYVIPQCIDSLLVNDML